MKIERHPLNLQFIATGTNNGRRFIVEAPSLSEAMTEAEALALELHGIQLQVQTQAQTRVA